MPARTTASRLVLAALLGSLLLAAPAAALVVDSGSSELQAPVTETLNHTTGDNESVVENQTNNTTADLLDPIGGGHVAVGESDENASAGVSAGGDGSSDGSSGTQSTPVSLSIGLGAFSAVALSGSAAASSGAASGAASGGASATSATSATTTTSANGLLASAAGTTWRGRAWRLLGLVGYSRYDDSDPLSHQTRSRLHYTIESEPGSYLSELARETDLSVSTVRHHLRILEEEDEITSAKLRGKRRFYPAHAENLELDAALSTEATARILDTIARRGPASVSTLAEELDRDPSTISHHLQRLEDDGLLERESKGKSVMTRLTSAVEQALRPDTPPASSGALRATGPSD